MRMLNIYLFTRGYKLKANNSKLINSNEARRSSLTQWASGETVYYMVLT